MVHIKWGDERYSKLSWNQEKKLRISSENWGLEKKESWAQEN